MSLRLVALSDGTPNQGDTLALNQLRTILDARHGANRWSDAEILAELERGVRGGLVRMRRDVHGDCDRYASTQRIGPWTLPHTLFEKNQLGAVR